MRVDAVAISRTNGTLMDCPICCEDELIELDFVCCPNMHAVCKNCVRRYVYLAIQVTSTGFDD